MYIITYKHVCSHGLKKKKKDVTETKHAAVIKSFWIFNTTKNVQQDCKPIIINL